MNFITIFNILVLAILTSSCGKNLVYEPTKLPANTPTAKLNLKIDDKDFEEMVSPFKGYHIYIYKNNRGKDLSCHHDRTRLLRVAKGTMSLGGTVSPSSSIPIEANQELSFIIDFLPVDNLVMARFDKDCGFNASFTPKQNSEYLLELSIPAGSSSFDSKKCSVNLYEKIDDKWQKDSSLSAIRFRPCY